mgnify:FL=1
MPFSGSTHIAAFGPIVCKVGQGQLVKVVVNRHGLNGCSLTLYDSASAAAGKVIANLDLVNGPIGEVAYDVICANGIVADMENGTVGDVTIVTD